VGLKDWADHTPPRCSGGQKQRVGELAPLADRQPRLILADEPTGALDSETSSRIMDLLGEIHLTGITMLVVTHRSGDRESGTQRTIASRMGASSTRTDEGRLVLDPGDSDSPAARSIADRFVAAPRITPGSLRRGASRSARLARSLPPGRGTSVLARSLDGGARHDPPQQAADGADDDQRRVGDLRAGVPARARGGMDNGLRYAFRREATNGIWISANKTSVPYAGYDVGRKLVFDNRDYERAKATHGVEHISGQYFHQGRQFGGAR